MGYYPRRIAMTRVILTGNILMARNTILGVFAKSPIKPLEKHIQIVVKCSKQLIPFFEACTVQDWSEAAKIRRKLSKLEQDADALKRQLRLELPGGLFMPVDRADLLELLTQQDKIANKAKATNKTEGGSTAIPIKIKTIARIATKGTLPLKSKVLKL